NKKISTNPRPTAQKSSSMDVPGHDCPLMRVTATLPPRLWSSRSPSTTFTNPGAPCFGVPNTQELCCSLISGAAGAEISAQVSSAGGRIPISWDSELTTQADTFVWILEDGMRLLRGSLPM